MSIFLQDKSSIADIVTESRIQPHHRPAVTSNGFGAAPLESEEFRKEPRVLVHPATEWHHIRRRDEDVMTTTMKCRWPGRERARGAETSADRALNELECGLISTAREMKISAGKLDERKTLRAQFRSGAVHCR
ncbi:hypothetical protein GWI33_003006 [Rhynchophorus ferrugineus]|uniref:Uncharacterized protein n=1 Tax=Rhynchophorus ferrugineus TaxID=354439 RepID=A0A834MF83_RHYFE|nr:hypothetical protein GWI33_003006 [Rhynchophorus ferrugineus]